jgi:hypothetical protein
MICPECEEEYRQGFTRCADCDVELVPMLPGAMVAQAKDQPEPGQTEEDPFCAFWKGEDPRVFAELCGVLVEAGIPYRSLESQDHLFNVTRFPVYRVAVPFSMFEKAGQVVVEAFGSAEGARESVRLLPEG